jgi:ERCC4-type nuclease
LPCGDYAVHAGDRLLASVERKTLEDYIKSLVDGSLAFALAELAALPSAVVVVEARYSQLLSAPRVQPGWLAELTARLHVRYPTVPPVICDSRKLAEDFTYRFLAAATAEHAGSIPPATGARAPSIGAPA